jgi:hypothetical protein
MKKTILFLTATIVVHFMTIAQDDYSRQLQTAVTRLDQAGSVKDYQSLATDFKAIADRQKKDWLPYYYAAFCNAKIGWLYQRDGDKIEPFADEADAEIGKALSLIDTAVQKKALSEIYCVQSMVSRARVFINPMSFGRKYGPAAGRYTQLALKTDTTNPRAYYLAGWEKYATPKLWGGDKKKAKELLEIAQKLLGPASTADVSPRWGRKEVSDLLHELK